MIKKTLLAIILGLILIQFIPLEKTNPKVDEKIALKTDTQVMSILKKSCYDCHSNETVWSQYSDIAPLSFGIVSHVNNGRQALNFSEWDIISMDKKIARVKRAIKTMKLDMMPLPSYLMFHDEAKINKNEKEVLIRMFDSFGVERRT